VSRCAARAVIIVLLVVCSGTPAAAQQPAPPRANPADVGSVDAILTALYDVISGDTATRRDWDRFRSLFAPNARLVPTGRRADGTGVMRVMSPDEYAASAAPFFAREGFFERESARRTETYGGMVHAFSTYESRHAPGDAQPFQRGINSIQLYHDGARWWVVTIMWWAETPAFPLPPRYLVNERN
jgi:hypothetical protein